jgi:hypothetical protein
MNIRLLNKYKNPLQHLIAVVRSTHRRIIELMKL